MDVPMYKRKGKSRLTVAPTVWSALPLLHVVQRLNQRCFSLLASSALGRADESSAVFAHQALWARVDEASLERAGRCPVLLLDLQFHDLDGWLWLLEGHEGP